MIDYSFNLKTIIGNYNYPRTGHFGVTYRGINFVKCPFDYVMYQMILNEVKPDLVIEIGTHEGGGALYFSDIVSKWGGQVHTIDIERKEYHPLISQDNNIKTFFDGYQNYDLQNTKWFNRILVIDDGSHHYEDVKNAFNKFSSLIEKGSYYIIEDGVIYFEDKNAHGGGPIKAINEITEEDKSFFIDRKWCDFFGVNATFNTNGYLKKL
jgi:cephalosporin hydroxylase